MEDKTGHSAKDIPITKLEWALMLVMKQNVFPPKLDKTKCLTLSLLFLRYILVAHLLC